jgi:hypothetical protein
MKQETKEEWQARMESLRIKSWSYRKLTEGRVIGIIKDNPLDWDDNIPKEWAEELLKKWSA